MSLLRHTSLLPISTSNLYLHLLFFMLPDRSLQFYYITFYRKISLSLFTRYPSILSVSISNLYSPWKIISRPDIFLSTFQLSLQATIRSNQSSRTSMDAFGNAITSWMSSVTRTRLPDFGINSCRAARNETTHQQDEVDGDRFSSLNHRYCLLSLSPSSFISLSIYLSIYLSPYVGANDSRHCLLVDNPRSRTSFTEATTWLMAEKLFPC